MSEADDAWRVLLQDTHEAVLKYASAELDALARKAVFGLQRLPASGIYGDEYRFKSVWDEYCHDVHHGPSPFLERTWEQTIGSFIDHAVNLLPRHVSLLVSIGADYERSSFENMTVCFKPDTIRDAVKDRIDRTANDRKMGRFYQF